MLPYGDSPHARTRSPMSRRAGDPGDRHSSSRVDRRSSHRASATVRAPPVRSIRREGRASSAISFGAGRSLGEPAPPAQSRNQRRSIQAPAGGGRKGRGVKPPVERVGAAPPPRCQPTNQRLHAQRVPDRATGPPVKERVSVWWCGRCGDRCPRGSRRAHALPSLPHAPRTLSRIPLPPHTAAAHPAPVPGGPKRVRTVRGA